MNRVLSRTFLALALVAAFVLPSSFLAAAAPLAPAVAVDITKFAFVPKDKRAKG